jgi:hypothetical protein
MTVLSSLLPGASRRRKPAGADVESLLERVGALERQTESLTARVAEALGAAARLERVVRQKVEAEVVRIEARVAAQRIETEVKAAAARLEATTPHYPRS